MTGLGVILDISSQIVGSFKDNTWTSVWCTLNVLVSGRGGFWA